MNKLKLTIPNYPNGKTSHHLDNIKGGQPYLAKPDIKTKQ